ncbi:Enamine deaminase RidA, house cleaning of reactive enamine intermediates, YjgF/YER057c/UK114 family [Paracoccus halophilus]|uniref:Enamine deaminase RidA, house cleaning of reactive enamine intermediates, YjgF/YER057c/UK114 family n=2 Tax=Paracoccus halophilus TaxID=376733 RepID=A0A099F2A0_9RHOB|nr:RidA family protein [Paracoccus halophilus]KGJ04376.1 endoribonuclease L-PSP [Paracoccus halophilus]SFA55011.1 Enamine deaminase RidA, house cleaning of reactive enamine intermediates, YjgF/YER057c/UK114 family [Paracoccus halophilus]
MQALNPLSIAAPFGRYSHGVATRGAGRLVLTSGQLGLRADGSLPEGALEQARQCFANCAAILAEAGLSARDVLRVNAFVTDRAYFADYMAARDAFLAGVEVLPASTLVIVSGFTRPEFLVEVELTAMERA